MESSYYANQDSPSFVGFVACFWPTVGSFLHVMFIDVLYV